MTTEKMDCALCKKTLVDRNKSGYCTKCYRKSPFYLEYQREFQRRWFANEKNKKKKKIYLDRPSIKLRYKKYQKKYQRENIDRLRVMKRDWARRNRHDRKEKK